MKRLDKIVSYFWVALISSLLTFFLARYYEADSGRSVFETKVGGGPNTSIVKILDLSAHPGAISQSYEISLYLPQLSLPVSSILYISSSPILGFRLENVGAGEFKIYGDGKLIASCRRQSWQVESGVLNK